MATFEYRQAKEIRDGFARHGVRYLFIGILMLFAMPPPATLYGGLLAGIVIAALGVTWLDDRRPCATWKAVFVRALFFLLCGTVLGTLAGIVLAVPEEEMNERLRAFSPFAAIGTFAGCIAALTAAVVCGIRLLMRKSHSTAPR